MIRNYSGKIMKRIYALFSDIEKNIVYEDKENKKKYLEAKVAIIIIVDDLLELLESVSDKV